MKANKYLNIILTVGAIISVLMIILKGVWIFPDSSSYIRAWDLYSNFEIDSLRTPVYPIFLGVIKTIFGSNLFQIVAIIIQHIVFLCSVAFLYKMAKWFIHSEKIVFILTLLYTIVPAFIICWNNAILTESFAISGMVFLMYVTISMLKEFSFTKLFLHTALLLIMIFLRPALVYILPVFAVSWLYFIFVKKERKLGFAALSSVVIVSLCLLSYMKVFENRFGIFASSIVNVNNQLFIARQYGLLDPDEISDKQLKEAVIQSYKDNGEYIREHSKMKIVYKDIWPFDIKAKNEAINKSYKAHPLKVAKKSIVRLLLASDWSMTGYSDHFVNGPSEINRLFDWGFKLKHLFFMLFIYGFILIYVLIKKNTFPFFSILFFMLGVSNIIVAVVGAQAEWSRLILPSMPLYLIMFGQFFNFTEIKSKPLSNNTII